MTQAVVLLRDGLTIVGRHCGADIATVGEVVFNTSMTGYQEIVTDPSYSQQIITFTTAHIGNTGVNTEDTESNTVHARGVIIRDLSQQYSNWRGQMTFAAYLQQHQITGIYAIDTRMLVRHLREHGSQDGAIVPVATTVATALGVAKQLLAGFAGIEHADLATTVTTTQKYIHTQHVWAFNSPMQTQVTGSKTIAVIDYGVKTNILRLIRSAGVKVIVLPATTTAEQISAVKADGVVLTNGPGDPHAISYTVKQVRSVLALNIPVLGICLGCQILALALGATTKKMKFGHHGANHPIIDVETKAVSITSQNHGFYIDEVTLPNTIHVTHRSLFDGSIQGIRAKQGNVIGLQGHPEASPGPKDIQHIFASFIDAIPTPHAAAN